PGAIKCIANEGMPHYKRPFDKGNLYVKFNVEFPPSLWINPEQLKKLEEFLPTRTEEDPSTRPEISDEVHLTDGDFTE
ncbi:3888_t:CDS:2, partial [Dentiscutata heterogama]